MSDEKKDAKTTGGVGHGAPLAVDKVLVFEVTESGSRAKRTLRFNKKRVVVGSVVSADVRLTGPGVSPIHAVIELGEVGGDGIATLYDIASESGVKVNGKSAVTQVLKNGDEIAIATDSIQFRVETVVEQPKEVQPKVPSRTAAPQKLFINPVADPVASLIDEDDEVEDIFDYRPSHKQALEVVMSWKGTILDVQHFVLEKEILVGPNMDCDFGIPAALSDERFPLAVQREGEGSFNLNVDATMGGVLQSGGKLRSIGEIAGQAPVQGTHGPQIPLGKDDFAKISLGNVDFYLSYTAAPPRLKARRLFERDPFF